MGLEIWTVIGIGVLIWAAVELVSGRTWMHREVQRSQEPALYWLLQVTWIFLGLACLAPLWQ